MANLTREERQLLRLGFRVYLGATAALMALWLLSALARCGS